MAVKKGEIFGTLKTVSKFTKGKNAYWNCECIETGKPRKVKQCDLISGKVIGPSRNHGMSSHQLYKTWEGMIARCYNPNRMEYKSYGGRGITVCERWRYFPNFLEDMGEKPDDTYSLERIDVNGNYEPNNCKWASREEQDNNKRNTSWVTFGRKKMSVAQLADRLGLDRKILDYHIKHLGRDPKYVLMFLSKKRLKNDDAKYYIGIDIGQKGGFAVIKNGKLVFYSAMPLGPSGKADPHKIFAFLYKFKDKNCHIIYEKLHGLPNQKLSVIWGLAKQVGFVETSVRILKIPFTEVTPQSWQKEMWFGVTVQNKKQKGKWVRDTKKTSLMAAKKLFPKENFLASERSRVPHDGIVDSILLAEFGKRKGL